MVIAEPKSNIGPPRARGRRIGFVSTRLGGTDGVSLEASKWAEVLGRLGHVCCYFAGQCDFLNGHSRALPEAHFAHAAVTEITTAAFGPNGHGPTGGGLVPKQEAVPAWAVRQRLRSPALTRRIHELTAHIKDGLYQFVRDFDLNLLLVENALALPMNLPLGLALTEFIAETGMPTLAHHHDFYWERQRYLVNCVADYLDMAFPPALPSIHHVVINSVAAAELSRRRALAATVIPNVMDFSNPPPAPDGYAASLRADLGIGPDEVLVLQPTRVVQRKGIEHAIEFVARLGVPTSLVLSHPSGDEGHAYAARLREYAGLLGVNLIMAEAQGAYQRSRTMDGRKVYALGDFYQAANLVTYPSLVEGFGNAFLEAVYFRRPLVVNRYPIYEADIRPKGWRVIELNGFVTEPALAAAREVLAQPGLAAEMAAHNYAVAKKHYSYEALERALRAVLASLLGAD